MRPEELSEITATLRTLGGGRVWSLMVSLFGDLALDEGAFIDGPTLSTMMSRLGVKPEAARVALHRLRNDGWIASEKKGRIGRHSLTEKGRAESITASPRIYSDPRATAEGWQLILTETGETAQSEALAAIGFVPLTGRVHVGSASLAVPAHALSLHSDAVPDWLRSQVVPTKSEPAYRALRDALRTLDEAIPSDEPLDPTNIAVLRCMIVHNWRRLVLRHPALPRALIDPSWIGHRCHLQVWDLLTRFPRPALDQIAQSEGT